jgi:hypothetical protein
MKEYFYALEGIKIENSPNLYKNICPFFHQNIRILNVSYNQIKNVEIFINNLPM